jgi:heme-degrading monooxygenase HmoA
MEAIKKWKGNTEHLVAQKFGKQEWYKLYKVRVAKVERDYGI